MKRAMLAAAVCVALSVVAQGSHVAQGFSSNVAQGSNAAQGSSSNVAQGSSSNVAQGFSSNVAQGFSLADPPTTKDQVNRWMTELSNWGRWGKDDQRGAVNLITPAKRQQGWYRPWAIRSRF